MSQQVAAFIAAGVSILVGRLLGFGFFGILLLALVITPIMIAIVGAFRDAGPTSGPLGKAARELDTNNVNIGAWTAALSEANGDPVIARQIYIAARAVVLNNPEAVLAVEDGGGRAAPSTTQRYKPSGTTKLRPPAPDLSTVDPAQLGTCPNCDQVLLLSSRECTKCPAQFGEQGGWKVKPLAQR